MFARSWAPASRTRCCPADRRTTSSPRRRRSTPTGSAQQNLLPIGGPYQIQAINAMDYVTTGPTVRRPGDTCCATRTTPTAKPGLEGLEFAAEQLDFEVADQVTFPGNTDFTAQISQLQSANCEMVLLVATPAETLAGRCSRPAGFAPQWMGQSPTWLKILLQRAAPRYLESNFLLACEGPEWGDTSVGHGPDARGRGARPGSHLRLREHPGPAPCTRSSRPPWPPVTFRRGHRLGDELDRRSHLRRPHRD